MNRSRRLSTTRDDGVYAVLYAALIVVLLAVAALVVDNASVRQDRRLNRSASDSAAIAGAAWVNPAKAGASPTVACQIAWRYLSTTLHIATPASACSAFSGYTLDSCPANEVPDSQIVGDLTIRIVWPVPSTSGFMTPDLAPGSASQPFSLGTDEDTGRGDGTSGGCERFGVAVIQNAKFKIAPAFGATGTQTQVHSVARYVNLPGNDEYNYPLVVLAKHGCSVLATGGTGTNIVVKNGTGASPSVPNLAGRIAVDSDGVTYPNSDPNSSLVASCTGNASILDVSGSGGYIQAQDGADAGTVPADRGAIEIYSTGVTYPADSYSAVTNQPCNPPGNTSGFTNNPCIGRPVARTERVTRAPFDVRFKPRIDQLVTAYNTLVASKSGSTWSLSGNGTGLTWVFVTGSQCNSAFTGTAAMGLNYFVNCPAEKSNWKLTAPMTFPTGSQVVVNGDLLLGGGGCFVTNLDPSWSPSVCYDKSTNTSPYRPADAVLTANSILSVRGNINASGGGDLVLPGTVLSQPTAGTSFTGTSLDDVYWTAPYGDKTTLENACKSGGNAGVPSVSCFRNLAYWTESNSLDTLQGGASLLLEGTFFLGNAPLKVGGNGNVFVDKSQFVALTITSSGGKPLTFTPDPLRTTGVPRSGVALIR